MNYDAADIAMRDMNRRNLRAFDRLKMLKIDELNILREVRRVYEQSVELAKRRFLSIARESYIAAMIEVGTPEEQARRKAGENITTDWLLDMLEAYDAVTLYQFFHEAERKQQRLAEAILASHDKNAQVDKALRLWSKQLAQYADNCVFYATIDGYIEAGVTKVRWETEGDDRVCADCDEMDGEEYVIDAVPDRPHWGCRCTIVPIKT